MEKVSTLTVNECLQGKLSSLGPLFAVPLRTLDKHAKRAVQRQQTTEARRLGNELQRHRAGVTSECIGHSMSENSAHFLILYSSRAPEGGENMKKRLQMCAP
jgi:hypothetical protein